MPVTQKNADLARKRLSQSFDFGRTTINHDSLGIDVGIFLDPADLLDQDRCYLSASNEEANSNIFVCNFVTDNSGVQIAIFDGLDK